MTTDDDSEESSQGRDWSGLSASLWWLLLVVVGLGGQWFLITRDEWNWTQIGGVVSDFGPAATFAAAGVAAVVGLSTLRQRSAADARDQWWKRAQWAIDKSGDRDESAAAIGHAVMRELEKSALAGIDEKKILRAATSIRLDVLEGQGDTVGSEFELEVSDDE